MSKAPRPSSNASIFADVVRGLLDETSLFSRNEWAAFLSITTSALSQWVKDRTVPRADLLRMVVDLLQSRGGTGAEDALARFNAILDEPAEAISPLGSRMAPTLRSYLAPKSLHEFAGSLRGMPAADQNAVLLEGSWDGPTGLLERETAWQRTISPPRVVWQCKKTHAMSGHGWDALLGAKRAIVTGGPGAGKSTTLLVLIDALSARGEAAHALSLRGCTGSSLRRWFQARQTVARNETFILDGFDEVEPDERPSIALAISDASDRAPASRLVFASRPIGELDWLDGFERFSIPPLSDVDVVAIATRAVSTHVRFHSEVDTFLCHLAEREHLKPPLRNILFLHGALSLFKQNKVTPFWEGAVLEECFRLLLERDRHKGLSRVREPWATSTQLLDLLGEFSLDLLRARTVRFEAHMLARWIESNTTGIAADRLLDLLIVQGLLVEDDDKLSFPYRVFPDYFAARYILESTDATNKYLEGWQNYDDLQGVIRIACSLATDATPLFDKVLSSLEGHLKHYYILAEMLAQPLKIDPESLYRGCLTLVSWLEQETAGWRLVSSGKGMEQPPASWYAEVKFEGLAGDKRGLARTLGAIHKARSGPARTPLKNCLLLSKSEFLPAFAEALEAEGRFTIGFDRSGPSRGAARAAVESLRLM